MTSFGKCMGQFGKKALKWSIWIPKIGAAPANNFYIIQRNVWQKSVLPLF